MNRPPSSDADGLVKTDQASPTGDQESRQKRDLNQERIFASLARKLFDEKTPPPRVGRFEVYDELGSGGMGDVYRAFDPELKRDVAIKVLASGRGDDEDASRRMMREAQALAQLSHPNVVRVYEVGSYDDRVFIAMELLEGETLSERLNRVERLSPRTTLSVIGDVCRAIGKAHELGIIHRDLKPGNIFLIHDDDGEHAKVLDFGISKSLSMTTLGASTMSGTILGTPYYMSPEQAKDSTDVDHRSDLWAVAVIAYECLVGERPFNRDSLPGLAGQILVEPIPVPSEHGEVPAGFDSWFAKGTERDPSDRFASARAMSTELKTVLGSDVPSASIPELSRAAERQGRRTGVWIGAAAGIGLGLLGWWALSNAATSSDDRGPEPPPVRSAPAVEVAAPAPRGDAVEHHPAPKRVEVRLNGPGGAAVYNGEELLGHLPDRLSLPRGETAMKLRITLDGYDDVEVDVVPNGDVTKTVEMKKRPVKSKKRGKAKPKPSEPKRPDPKQDDVVF